MPMLLDITRKLFARSDRVKAVDFHPSEPWLLAGLYTGAVNIWNYETGTLIKTFEVAEVPVRCVKFIARKNWFVAGSDDFQLRCFNYNTHEKVIAFEAHPDYIRCIAIHPTGSYVLTGSDDMTIKMWDWEKNWKHLQTFEGHTHFVMNLAFNPKDSNSFASACLDRTVKIWTPGTSAANFTLDAHEKGVNYVEYYHGGEKPYLVTTGDDKTVKIWDYISKSCVQTLEGHVSNVSFACFHPSLPLIISGSEDGTVKLWHSNTYRLETTLDYSLERAWCVAYRRTGNDIAIGYDEGVVVVKLGKEEPSASMDTSGKLVWTKGAEVLSANLGAIEVEGMVDGQRIAAGQREMGTTEIYTQSLQHSPNGRFVTVCGDGEYIIYTALAWRNKAFGPGYGFAWAADSNTYAVKESNSLVKVFRNFRERSGLLTINYAVEEVKGGALLGIIAVGFVCLYDWDTGSLVRRIEVEAKDIIWSSTGELVAIVGSESFYILRFDRQALEFGLDNGQYVEDEGVEASFNVVTEIGEVVKTAKWTGECFIYTNAQNRIQYLVGEQTHTVNHTDKELYLLGYLPAHGRVYLVDKDVSLYSFALSLSVVEYQTAILREDFVGAKEILKTVPADQRNRIARFLESQNLKTMALEVSTDPDHKFELAVSLDDLNTALEISQNGPEAGSELRWRTIGDKALQQWNLPLAIECFEKAQDLQTLFLIASSIGDRSLLERVAQGANDKKIVNLALNCYLQLGDARRGIEVLVKSGRLPEAALLARSYAPSSVARIVELWQLSLKESRRSKQDAIADSLGHPQFAPEAFEEGWQDSLHREDELLHKNPIARAKSNEVSKVVGVMPLASNGVKERNPSRHRMGDLPSIGGTFADDIAPMPSHAIVPGSMLPEASRQSGVHAAAMQSISGSAQHNPPSLDTATHPSAAQREYVFSSAQTGDGERTASDLFDEVNGNVGDVFHGSFDRADHFHSTMSDRETNGV